MSDVSPDGGIKEGCLNLKPSPCIESVGVERLHKAGPCVRGLWPFRLEKSEGVLGNSGRKPEEAPGHSEWKPVGHSNQIKRLVEP